MSFQQCADCGDSFSGDDDDEKCDDCAIMEIEACAERTGHEKTETVDGQDVCRECGLIVNE